MYALVLVQVAVADCGDPGAGVAEAEIALGRGDLATARGALSQTLAAWRCAGPADRALLARYLRARGTLVDSAADAQAWISAAANVEDPAGAPPGDPKVTLQAGSDGVWVDGIPLPADRATVLPRGYHLYQTKDDAWIEAVADDDSSAGLSVRASHLRQTRELLLRTAPFETPKPLWEPRDLPEDLRKRVLAVERSLSSAQRLFDRFQGHGIYGFAIERVRLSPEDEAAIAVNRGHLVDLQTETIGLLLSRPLPKPGETVPLDDGRLVTDLEARAATAIAEAEGLDRELDLRFPAKARQVTPSLVSKPRASSASGWGLGGLIAGLVAVALLYGVLTGASFRRG